MKQKILFIIWALEVGGAERLLVKLAQKIPRERYEVTIACISRKGVWAKEVEDSGIRVISFDKRTGFDPSILKRLISFIRSERPDIVNTYLWTADLWGRLAAILAGSKHIIVTEQNVDLWKRWYHKVIDRILFKWTDYAICVSDEVVNFYHHEFKLPLDKLRMIPNAIDVSLFDSEIDRIKEREKLGLRADEFVFVCAARLHQQKAHHVLINAVAELIRSGNKGFKVLLVGEGALRQQLEEMVNSMELKSYVQFLGLRQDIPDILLLSDAFVLSSDYEGLSLAILEAMAAKLPVVATSVGGNPQIVENGVTGYLVSPQNAEELSGAMKMIMSDCAKAIKMGNAGRKRIEKDYEIKAITMQTLQLFEECRTNVRVS